MRAIFIVYPSLFSLLLSFFLMPLVCQAWNPTGHMVAAQIAYDNLQPDVRIKVDKITANLSKDYPAITNFVQMAPWPDGLRAQKIENYTHWHYVDYAFSTDGSPLKNLIDTDNAVDMLSLIMPVVHNAKANPAERARFLAFLIHIVADVHQPLHTVSRISSAHLDGDKGGNLFFVTWKNKKTALHHVWDTGLGEFDVEPTSDNVSTIAKRVTELYPKNAFGTQITNLDQKEWVKEESEDVQSIVYATPENQKPNSDYIEKGQQLSDKRIALAGYRLAAVLNHLLGD